MVGQIIANTRPLCIRVETRLKNMGLPIVCDSSSWNRIYTVSNIDGDTHDKWEYLKSMFGNDVIFKEDE